MRAVFKNEALRVAEEHGVEYFETSAKEDVNVKELMNHIMKVVFENEKRKQQRAEEEEDGIVTGKS